MVTAGDKSKYQLRADSPLDYPRDRTRRITGLLSDTGFIENVMARSWQDIAQTAQMNLAPMDRGTIEWHKPPSTVQY